MYAEGVQKQNREGIIKEWGNIEWVQDMMQCLVNARRQVTKRDPNGVIIGEMARFNDACAVTKEPKL